MYIPVKFLTVSFISRSPGSRRTPTWFRAIGDESTGTTVEMVAPTLKGETASTDIVDDPQYGKYLPGLFRLPTSRTK